MDGALAIGQLIIAAGFAVYCALAALCLYFALKRPKTAKQRVGYTAIVVAVFGFLPGKVAFENWQDAQYRKTAFARFEKLCNEKAGEKIHKVIGNVEAVFLEKPRSRASEVELRDQFWLGDPYGYSLAEALNPAGAFLHDRVESTGDTKFSAIKGYKYVEMPNPAYREGSDSKPYIRYRLEWRDVPNERIGKPERKLVPVGEPVGELRSRYAVTWADISTLEERQYWIAGGALTIYDLKDKTIVGERIGYVMDPGAGNTSGGRQIWPNSIYCPRFENHLHRNKEFVAKVLKAVAMEETTYGK